MILGGIEEVSQEKYKMLVHPWSSHLIHWKQQIYQESEVENLRVATSFCNSISTGEVQMTEDLNTQLMEQGKLNTKR